MEEAAVELVDAEFVDGCLGLVDFQETLGHDVPVQVFDDDFLGGAEDVLDESLFGPFEEELVLLELVHDVLGLLVPLVQVVLDLGHSSLHLGVTLLDDVGLSLGDVQQGQKVFLHVVEAVRGTH